jgi:hypothetical protein
VRCSDPGRRRYPIIEDETARVRAARSPVVESGVVAGGLVLSYKEGFDVWLIGSFRDLLQVTSR